MSFPLRRFAIPFFTASILIVSAVADDWPDDPKNIVAEFGRPALGGFGRGLGFAAAGQRISPWGDGELIWTGAGSAVSEPNLIVLEHPGGFRSTYRRVEPRPDLGDFVLDGDWLGYADSETWAFEITDSIQSRIVDPVTLLPERSLPEASKDLEVVLIRGNEETLVRDGMSVSPGRWTFAIQGGILKQIGLYWVGESMAKLRFDSLAEIDGRVMMETPQPVAYEDIYDQTGRFLFRDLMLNSGRGTLELRIREEGNETMSKTWNLNVRG